ncbi:hypothetical protein E4T56_gene13914 [Termitomyces sp. T112]|nr:hypothetical protein E4T56_gene13914 [Termitomyces sp. T112]
MTGSETTTCPILNGPDNFQIWKFRITVKLRQEKVWDIIAGTTTPSASTKTQTKPLQSPTDTTTALISLPQSQKDNWQIQDFKAAGIIIMHVSNRLAIEVGDLDHSKEMFDKLMFITMLDQKWDGSPATLSDHISSISTASAKLTAMKRQVDHKFLAFILLHSLPDDTVWELFCATVLNSLTPGTSLSFSTLLDQLTFMVTAQQGASSDAAPQG